jgi:hypothetical protein
MPDKGRVRLTASEAREEFLARAGELWDEFDAWYEANPDATFDEIDEHLGQRRRAVLGELLELRLRQDDLGATPQAPLCRKCGEVMEFKGYLPKSVQGLDIAAEISRAYFHCPACKEGIFPPGPEAAAEEGDLQ